MRLFKYVEDNVQDDAYRFGSRLNWRFTVKTTVTLSVSHCDSQSQSLKGCASVPWTRGHVTVQRRGSRTTPRPRGARCFTTADAEETRITSRSGSTASKSASGAERVRLF